MNLLDYNVAVYDYSNKAVYSSAKANTQTYTMSYAYDVNSGIVTLTSVDRNYWLRVSGVLTSTTDDVITS